MLLEQSKAALRELFIKNKGTPPPLIFPTVKIREHPPLIFAILMKSARSTPLPLGLG